MLGINGITTYSTARIDGYTYVDQSADIAQIKQDITGITYDDITDTTNIDNNVAITGTLSIPSYPNVATTLTDFDTRLTDISYNSVTDTTLINNNLDVSGNNIFQSGGGIINQLGGTGTNLLKSTNITGSSILGLVSTARIVQTGTGTNNLGAITMNSNTNLTQSGTGIISQTGTGTNLLKSVDVTGNINFTGNLTQNNVIYAPPASTIALTSDNTSGNYYIPFTKTTASTANSLFIDDTTTPLTYNPLSATLSIPVITQPPVGGSIGGGASVNATPVVGINSNNYTSGGNTWVSSASSVFVTGTEPFRAFDAVPDNAILFNGTSGYSTCGTNYQYTTGTIEMWIRNVGTGGFAVTYQTLGGVWGRYALYLYGTTNTLIAYNYVTSTNITTSINVTDGLWHHVALVFQLNNTTNGSKIYYDGVPVLTFTLTGTNASPTTTFAIGAVLTPTNPAGQFSGYIDDVRVWNTVRTDAQILDNYNKYISPATSGLTGYWLFNEGTGTTSVNQVSGGTSATLLGGYSWVTRPDTVSTIWESNANYNASGDYTGASSTTIVGVGSVLGEWLQLQFSYQFALTQYTLKQRTKFEVTMPRVFYIVGSNDGTTWNQVDYRSYTNNSTGLSQLTNTITNNTLYNLYRIVINKIYTIVSGTQNTEMLEWVMSGTLPANAFNTLTKTDITDTTVSTTTTTGALVVSGGVGIAENVNIGGTQTSIGVFAYRAKGISTTKLIEAKDTTSGAGISLVPNNAFNGYNKIHDTTLNESAIVGTGSNILNVTCENANVAFGVKMGSRTGIWGNVDGFCNIYYGDDTIQYSAPFPECMNACEDLRFAMFNRARMKVCSYDATLTQPNDKIISANNVIMTILKIRKGETYGAVEFWCNNSTTRDVRVAMYSTSFGGATSCVRLAQRSTARVISAGAEMKDVGFDTPYTSPSTQYVCVMIVCTDNTLPIMSNDNGRTNWGVPSPTAGRIDTISAYWTGFTGTWDATFAKTPINLSYKIFIGLE